MRALGTTVAVVLGLIASPALAQPSEADIAAAIQQGAKDKNKVFAVRLDAALPFSQASYTPFIVLISGPLNRIQDAASVASKEYRPFTREDVTAEMLADEIIVTAAPKTPRSVQDRTPRAERIVIQTRTKPPMTIQPTREEPLKSEWTNGFGATIEGRGMEAAFPRSAVPQGEELEVVIVTQLKRETRLIVKKQHLEKLK